MNPFESALAAALEAEVQETAMSVNTDRGTDELNDRMDAADRNKRQRTWLVAAAAVVVVMVAGAAFAGSQTGGEAQQLPGTDPSPQTSTAPREPAANLGDSFTVDLPKWVTESMTEPSGESPVFVTWHRCPSNGDCIGLSFQRFTKVYRPGPDVATAMPPYAGYVKYVKSLEKSGIVTLSDEITTTVDGRASTVFTVTPREDLYRALGCNFADGSKDDCWDFYVAAPTRLAVVEAPDGPLIILTRTARTDAKGKAWMAQFDDMLSTVRFN